MFKRIVIGFICLLLSASVFAAKSLVLERTEITASGTVQILMRKLSSDGDVIGNHRTAVDACGNVDAQFSAVNQHMAGEGYTAVPAADVAKIKVLAATACQFR